MILRVKIVSERSEKLASAGPVECRNTDPPAVNLQFGIAGIEIWTTGYLLPRENTW